MYYVVPWAATLARWGARLLSGLLLLCWGFFLLAHLAGDGGRASRPLGWQDYLVLTALAVSLAGLALAWKWELTGAAVALAAAGVGVAVNWRVLLSPGLLIPQAAVLFLSAWWTGSTTRGLDAASAVDGATRGRRGGR